MPAGVLSRGVIAKICGRRRHPISRGRVTVIGKGVRALRRRVPAVREAVAVIGADVRAVESGVNICWDRHCRGNSFITRNEGVLTFGKDAKLI